MSDAPVLRTERLLLRGWRPEDHEPFAVLNADAHVMEFMPKRFTRAESDAMVERIAAHFDAHGYGLWAVEVPGVAPFVGFTGLQIPRFEAPFFAVADLGRRKRWLPSQVRQITLLMLPADLSASITCIRSSLHFVQWASISAPTLYLLVAKAMLPSVRIDSYKNDAIV